jgi:endonuclease-3
VCKARTPECWRCPVVDLCAFKAKVLAKGAKPMAAAKREQGATKRVRAVAGKPIKPAS